MWIYTWLLDTPLPLCKHSAADSGKHASSVIEGGVRLWPPTNVVRKGGGVEEGGRGSKDLQADWVSNRRSRQGKTTLSFFIWVPRRGNKCKHLIPKTMNIVKNDKSMSRGWGPEPAPIIRQTRQIIRPSDLKFRYD